MMKRILKISTITMISIIIIELTISSFTLADTFLHQQKKKDFLVVDKNGQGDFKTINEAIDYSPINSVIYIKNGEYKEIIDIKKPVSLIGEDVCNTIINPISEKNKFAIRLGASGIKIKNLSISNEAPGPYSNGVNIVSPNTEISYCNIYENPIGIAIWTSNNLIMNCNIWDCKDEAIVLLGTSYSDCNNNSILNCNFYDNCDGIELQYSSFNTIRNCRIYNNTHTGIDAISTSNNKNVISNCEIYNNEVHGIYISSSSENKIIDCNIFDNGEEDVIFTGKSKFNQLISTSDLNDNNKMSSLVKLKNILNKISNPLIQKIVSILESFVYFKEKYKF